MPVSFTPSKIETRSIEPHRRPSCVEPTAINSQRAVGFAATQPSRSTCGAASNRHDPLNLQSLRVPIDSLRVNPHTSSDFRKNLAMS